MPLYEYTCDTCGRLFEKRLPVDSDHSVVDCPEGHHRVHRIYTVPSVVFKGSGFYVTDHPSGSSHDNSRS